MAIFCINQKICDIVQMIMILLMDRISSSQWMKAYSIIHETQARNISA